MRTSLPRREFLQGCLGAAALGALGSRAPVHAANQASAGSAAGGAADLDLLLRSGVERISLLEGPSTEVWRFRGQLLRGPRDALVESTSGYLGPTLRVKRGQRLRIRFENGLKESSIVHWHGLHVPQHDDGHPSDAVGPGGHHDYDFEVRNHAGLYWYHPHPHMRTGPQVYGGMAGLLRVSDDDEERLGLPDGERELPLVLQDRLFDENNQLVYAHNSMIGFLGDQLLVNGRRAATMEVHRGPHRLRLLNGSNSRIYDLAWSDGNPLTVLGTDGGLLEAPHERSHVLLAPGQRLDLWADFGRRPGADVWLESRTFHFASPMMGMGRGAGLANGAPFRIQRFVASGKGSDGAPPTLLVQAPGADVSRVSNPDSPRMFAVSMRGMRWFLNGRPFEMREVAPNERVRLGTIEDWEFVNSGGPMAMAHPIHVHGKQFQIVSRQSWAAGSRTIEGVFDEGWQDTFLLLPGERVRIRVAFERYPGLFPYHCHNLEHEDMGMMRNFLVESA